VRLVAARLTAAAAEMTPEELALIIAVGFVFGTFPVLGVAGILCAAAALVFRLNMPALQVVGQMVTPAQYALLLPLARIGVRVAGFHPGIGGAVVHAVAGWLCVCVPLGFVLYVAAVSLMRRRGARYLGEISQASGVPGLAAPR
jgi:hypothetical protein